MLGLLLVPSVFHNLQKAMHVQGTIPRRGTMAESPSSQESCSQTLISEMTTEAVLGLKQP